MMNNDYIRGYFDAHGYVYCYPLKGKAEPSAGNLSFRTRTGAK